MNSSLLEVFSFTPLGMQSYILLVIFTSAVRVATAPVQPCNPHWAILDEVKSIPTEGLTFCDGSNDPPTGTYQIEGDQTGGTTNQSQAVPVQSGNAAPTSQPASQPGVSLAGAPPILKPIDTTPGISITNDSCYGGNVEQVKWGSCKPGFRNTVFNPNAVNTPGWPDGPWKTIKQFHVTNFSQSPFLARIPLLKADTFSSCLLHGG